MKKTLIALAVLAVSGAAFAQSSVTLYGVADLAFSKVTDKTGEMSGNSSTGSNGTVAGLNGKLAANNGSSRFGLRGTEDLGGGMKAKFNFEAEVNAETGATKTALFDRAANLALAGNFGEVRLGRGLSLAYEAAGAYDVVASTNYSVIERTFGYAGNKRNDSEVRYTTPEFVPGLKLGVGYQSKADNLVGATTTPVFAGVPTSKYDLAAIYNNGPIAAGLAYSKSQNAEKAWSVGGAYTFGAFKVAASYHDPVTALKGFTVGGAATFGAASIALDVARTTGQAVNSTNYILEGKYNLSKRTFTYAALQRQGSTSTNGVSVGIRHNF